MSKTSTLCSATDCKEPSVGHIQDLIEVPRWRLPGGHNLQYRAYELIGTWQYCKAHEEVAKETGIASRG